MLPSQHAIVRCALEHDGEVTSGSVVVKEVTATEFTSGAGSEPSHRYLNEFAALEFLGAGSAEGPWPTLIAHSIEDGILVLEDIGSRQTVQEILLGDDAELAARALADMGTALGELHAAAFGRVGDFTRRRAELGVSPVLSDSTRDLREDIHLFEESLEHFGVKAQRAFYSELGGLESRLSDPGPLQTVIHADAGPQNFIHLGHGAVLVDFEFMSPGNALLDLVSARLGFPHSEEGRRIPIEQVEVVESNYRVAAGVSMPEMGDDQVFGSALVDACAHWALGRWARLWRRLFSDSSDNSPGMVQQRAQTLSVYEEFIVLADRRRQREALAGTLTSCVGAIRDRFPGIERSTMYECFAAESASNA